MSEIMNEILIANLTLDTTRKNNIPPLVVPQGDYGARVIRAKLTDLGKPVIVESTAAASIVATRSGDGESKAFSGRVNADGTVTVPVTQWMLDVPEEDVTCHIVVTGIGYQYSTTSFLIEPKAKATPTEIAHDDHRQDLVTEVLAGENTRRAAEAERVSNENARIAAENARQSAEEQRLTDESTRITNEAQRVSAEASRDATFKSWAQDIASLPTFDGRISANRKRIENLESGIPAESFILDDSVAYTKDVPENVAPNAVVQKVGGMTRKCANLFGGDAFANKIVEFGGIKNESAGIVFFSASLASGKTAYSNFKANTQYTFIIKASVSTPGGINLHLKYTDGTKKILDFGDANTVKTRLYVSESGKSVESFSGEWQADTTYYYNECGIFEGVIEQSDFEPYFEGLRSAKVTEVKSVGVNIFKPIYFNQFIANGCTISHIEDGFKIIVNADDPFWSYIDERFGLEEGDYYFYCQVNDGAYAVVQNPYGEIVKNGDPISIRTGRGWHFELEGYSIGKTYDVKIAFTKIPVNQFPYYTCNTLPIPEAVRPANGINENVYDYIEWAEDGSIKKTVKCGVVDLGEQQWNKAATSEFYADIDDNIVATWEGYACLCAKYTRAEQPTVVNNGEMVLATKNQSGTAGRLFIVDNNYTDVASFKAAMQGVMLVYQLAEPEVTDISGQITADNLIGVEGGGTLTFENEHKYAVPSTIIYQSR